MVKENDYLPRLHSEILSIMDCIDSVCKCNGIRYYLIGGTLLGAIRHNGFIPWDDDLDIVMPRDDFNRFVTIMVEEKPYQLRLEWITTNPKYYRLFAKVCRPNTRFAEDMGNGRSSDFGIFVDVFPLDATNGYNKNVMFRKWVESKINVMISEKAYPSTRKGIKQAVIKLFSFRFLHKVSFFFMHYPVFKKYGYYTNFGSHYDAKRQTMPKAYYGDGIEYTFEDRKFIIPSNYDAVLRSIFGNKYMEIPPKSKQITHHPLFVQFSDGSFINFD